MNSHIVAKLSPHIKVDADDVEVQSQEVATLIEELDFALYSNLKGILMSLHGLNITNLARLVYKRILLHPSVWYI